MLHAGHAAAAAPGLLDVHSTPGPRRLLLAVWVNMLLLQLL